MFRNFFWASMAFVCLGAAIYFAFAGTNFWGWFLFAAIVCGAATEIP